MFKLTISNIFRDHSESKFGVFFMLNYKVGQNESGEST